MKDIIINNILNDLRSGSTRLVYDNKQYLNNYAMMLYNKTGLSKDELEDFKNIILICNITYNDTDKELLPIEDGIYDLLLEKYKKYDPKFQVGAEVINFTSSEPIITNNNGEVIKPMREAISFNPIPDKKDNYFVNNIIVDERKYLDYRDFIINNNYAESEYITKRLHDTSHNHPELVGTLDKCKFVLERDAITRGVYEDSNVKIVERDFIQDHIKRGIINTNTIFDMVLELKYDGISIEADCTDVIVSARSRGDTGIGKASDLTPILKGYRFPHRTPNSPMVGVKFEAIITQYDLPFFNKAKNYDYKNCRSAIVGLFSSSDAWKYRDFITLVPLAVEEKIYKTVCNSDRVQEIEFLNKEFISKGCPLRSVVVRGNYLENLIWINMFTENAESSRPWVPFMYDGIVASYRDENIRKSLGRENFINKYSIAVKFNPLRKETIFRGYTYTVGQDGSITPMIHYDPVEFYGTIHAKSSGHSFARFKELNLHLGDILAIEYVNDVMPYVYKPFNDFNLDNEKRVSAEVFPTNCPICGSPIEISDSGKSAKCINPDCGGRQLARMVNMFAKLGLEGFGEATIQQLGYYHLKDLLEEMIMIDQEDRSLKFINKGFGPVEAVNITNQLIGLLKDPITDAKLLGAIGFTGISTKTWETILSKIKYSKLRELFTMIDPGKFYYKKGIEFMSSIKGIGPAIADTIAREFKYFYEDIDYMIQHGNVVEYVPVKGKIVKLSGTRDKALVKLLTDNGFIVDFNRTITKDVSYVVVPTPGFTSYKTQMANSYNIPIVPMEDIMNNIERYK